MAQHSPISFVAKLAIGLPVYDAEEFLPQALDSLSAQTIRNFEIIISDDASTDRPPQICREYVSRDNRIRHFRSDTNLGARASRSSNQVYAQNHTLQPPCKTTFSAACRMKRRVSLPFVREHLIRWSFNA